MVWVFTDVRALATPASTSEKRRAACYAVTDPLRIVTDGKSEKSSIKARIVTLLRIDGGVSVRCISDVIGVSFLGKHSQYWVLEDKPVTDGAHNPEYRAP